MDVPPSKKGGTGGVRLPTSAIPPITPIAHRDTTPDDARRVTSERRHALDRATAELRESFGAVKQLSPEQLLEWLIENHHQVLVVDVRSAEERNFSIIPRAISREAFEQKLKRCHFLSEKKQWKPNVVFYDTYGMRSVRYTDETMRRQEREIESETAQARERAAKKKEKELAALALANARAQQSTAAPPSSSGHGPGVASSSDVRAPPASANGQTRTIAGTGGSSAATAFASAAAAKGGSAAATAAAGTAAAGTTAAAAGAGGVRGSILRPNTSSLAVPPPAGNSTATPQISARSTISSNTYPQADGSGSGTHQPRASIFNSVNSLDPAAGTVPYGATQTLLATAPLQTPSNQTPRSLFITPSTPAATTTALLPSLALPTLSELPPAGGSGGGASGAHSAALVHEKLTPTPPNATTVSGRGGAGGANRIHHTSIGTASLTPPPAVLYTSSDSSDSSRTRVTAPTTGASGAGTGTGTVPPTPNPGMAAEVPTAAPAGPPSGPPTASIRTSIVLTAPAATTSTALTGMSPRSGSVGLSGAASSASLEPSHTHSNRSSLTLSSAVQLQSSSGSSHYSHHHQQQQYHPPFPRSGSGLGTPATINNSGTTTPMILLEESPANGAATPGLHSHHAPAYTLPPPANTNATALPPVIRYNMSSPASNRSSVTSPLNPNGNGGGGNNGGGNLSVTVTGSSSGSATASQTATPSGTTHSSTPTSTLLAIAATTNPNSNAGTPTGAGGGTGSSTPYLPSAAIGTASSLESIEEKRSETSSASSHSSHASPSQPSARIASPVQRKVRPSPLIVNSAAVPSIPSPRTVPPPSSSTGTGSGATLPNGERTSPAPVDGAPANSPASSASTLLLPAGLTIPSPADPPLATPGGGPPLPSVRSPVSSDSKSASSESNASGAGGGIGGQAVSPAMNGTSTVAVLAGDEKRITPPSAANANDVPHAIGAGSVAPAPVVSTIHSSSSSKARAARLIEEADDDDDVERRLAARQVVSQIAAMGAGVDVKHSAESALLPSPIEGSDGIHGGKKHKFGNGTGAGGGASLGAGGVGGAGTGVGSRTVFDGDDDDDEPTAFVDPYKKIAAARKAAAAAAAAKAGGASAAAVAAAAAAATDPVSRLALSKASTTAASGKASQATALCSFTETKLLNLNGGILQWLHLGGPLMDSLGRETTGVHVYLRTWDFAPPQYDTVWFPDPPCCVMCGVVWCFLCPSCYPYQQNNRCCMFYCS